jgi:hypothetical protein
MKRLILSIFILILASCGGGGGGGGGGVSDNYEGDLHIELERDHIDSGDLNRITIDVTNLNQNGSVLKIRTSPSLKLVRKSAILFPDRSEERPISADADVGNENERFTVFFLYPSDALDDDYVSLEFTLKAVSGDEDGFIEVDLDNNDPNTSDSSEFSLSQPRFTAKLRRSIFIESDSSAPTPTPTPSGTETPSE